jgi:predicted MFS family arabinose efflux permease
MSVRKVKVGCLILTWLNIYAVAYYFNYLFFHLRHDFGFGNRENLLFAALNGLIYVPASWCGGKFAQRAGCFAALKVGFAGMALLLGMGAFLDGLVAQTVVMALWTVAVCFTWAPLEALASEKESRAGLAHMVGLYNVVWSAGAAVAYFTGGALQHVLGKTSLYWLPALFHAVQFVLAWWLEKQSRVFIAPGALESPGPLTPSLSPSGGEGARRAGEGAGRFKSKQHHDATEESPNAPDAIADASAGSAAADYTQHHISAATASSFLRLAWLANPFAYVAMNTVIPLIPDLAARFSLSTTQAGFVASVWLFARLSAFTLLWHWTGWHYRFGWLLAAYITMVVSFLALLLGPNLAVILVAQGAFGLAVGLIYYSSLFYSMDVGEETQGEHGGRHEALIGLGIFAGPAVGTAALQFLPSVSHAGIAAVGCLLFAGLPALLWLRPRVNQSN